MKRKEYIKSFLGIFIGIIFYEFFIDMSELFQNAWANYFTEIAVLLACVYGGIGIVTFLSNKYSHFQAKENA